MPENGGIVMVTIVPSFVSKAVSDHADRVQRERARLQAQYGADTAAARAALDRWRAQNPEPRATMDDVIAHLEHVKQVAGMDHVGIGADYDGIDSTPDGLEDVSSYPALFEALARRGWSDEDLRKLAGENVLRVMRDAEKAARLLQRERGPSVRTIEELDG